MTATRVREALQVILCEHGIRSWGSVAYAWIMGATDMDNRIMLAIMNKSRPEDAARVYLRQNPDVLNLWLKDVQTFDGKSGKTAVRAALLK